MGIEEIIPSIALILVLILVLPGFIKSNLKNKEFFKNLSIWGIIVLALMIFLYLTSGKIGTVIYLSKKYLVRTHKNFF